MSTSILSNRVQVLGVTQSHWFLWLSVQSLWPGGLDTLIGSCLMPAFLYFCSPIILVFI